jgi:hypothetical protein
MWTKETIEELRNNFSEKWNFGFLLDSAREQFVGILEDAKEEDNKKMFTQDNILEIMHDITDNILPVMTYDILMYSSNHLELATLEPEILGFNGEKTGVNCIVGNMYEAIMTDLDIYWNEIYTLFKKEEIK